MEGWPVTIRGPAAPDDTLVEAHEAVCLEARRAGRPMAFTIVDVEAVAPDAWRVVLEGDEPLPEGSGWEDARLTTSAPGAADASWAVLEVDADRDAVIVEGSAPPERGPCRIRGHAFLEALRHLLGPEAPRAVHAVLAGRLALAAGAPGTPIAPIARGPDLPPSWSHDWSLLWGPPGTGKTTTLARVLTALLDDPDERVLVLSTTNRAVDDVALRLARSLRDGGRPVDGVRRLGRAHAPDAFLHDGLGELLPIRDPVDLAELHDAEVAVRSATTVEARVDARKRLMAARRRGATLRTHGLRPEVRCAVTTVHAAVTTLRHPDVLTRLVGGRAPFTTVVVDEAGLVSRAHAAAASLWAARRVVLAGDPRQLSPIVQAARSMPRPLLRWLARSPLDHLGDDASAPHVERLTVQHRMHPDVRAAVSHLAYGGALADGPRVTTRGWPGSGTLARLPRAAWYVLDEHHPERPAAVASEPGPSGRSRVRPLGIDVLEALLHAQPELRDLRVLVVSPYRAHGAAVRRWIRARGLARWQASTVHAQQGAEAEVVVFDTVHASSSGWPPDEWQRLVNVGLSRAEQLVLLLASRAEVAQPWLAPLRRHLVGRVLRARGDRRVWETVDGGRADDLFAPAAAVVAAEPGVPLAVGDALGAQIARRRALRPVLSHEQAVLVHRDLHDAGPRVVRGVAGSGKSLVLAHWAVRALRGLRVDRVTIVFANEALRGLLEALLADAWAATGDGAGLPWSRVEIVHVRTLLRDLLRERDLPPPGDGREAYDYPGTARRLLADDVAPLAPRFQALFVDEAQDLGHETLDLLVRLTVPGADGRRAVMVFYDDAQRVYEERSRPTWSRLGLDVRGRTEVMRESFRSTRPCVELGLDLLDRLRPLQDDPDLRELMQPRRPGERPLLWRDGPRWRAGFCAVEGEAPEVAILPSRDDEAACVAERVRAWIEDEGVDPRDVVVIAMGQGTREPLVAAIRRALGGRVPVELRTTQGYTGRAGVVVTTPHSFKGYDAEVVVVATVDRFRSGDRILATPLWVALTRARTAMLVTAVRDARPDVVARRLVGALEDVAALHGATVPRSRVP